MAKQLIIRGLAGGDKNRLITTFREGDEEVRATLTAVLVGKIIDIGILPPGSDMVSFNEKGLSQARRMGLGPTELANVLDYTALFNKK